MASPIQDGVPSRRRRPRDRKRRILAAAARQFWDLGYHQVGMADIAAAVGIGASALYRHFRGKQDLLVAVMHEALDWFERLRPDGSSADPNGLDRIIAATACAVLDRREFGALWDREAGHLPDGERDALRRRLRGVIGRAAETIVAEHRQEPGVAKLRAHAMYAVLESPSFHRVELDRTRFEQLLDRAAHAVVRAELPVAPQPARRRGPGRAPQIPVTRREALLTAAIRLFGERGYPSVSMTDIGTSTGIAGPSIYNHVGSKLDLLVGAMTRGNEALWLALHHAMACADGPLDALHRALDSYAGFATANPAIISVMLAEVINLPDEQRATYRRVQQEYVAEWVTLLRRSRPELDESTARVLVHTALAIANALARVHSLQHRPSLDAEISAVARAVLATPIGEEPPAEPRHPELK